MPPTHISGTSRALYRVFVAPNLRSTTSIPLLYAPAFAPSSRHSSTPPSTSNTQPPRFFSHTCIREKKYTKDTRRHALSDYYVIDAAIQADAINLVDETGKFHTDVPLNDALASFNKVTHHLVQMTPGKIDASGRADPANLPTCRIISKMDLRAQHQRKLDTLRRQAKGQTTGPSPKSLELNWAIAAGDLKHRLERLKEFLREGRKVEILLGPKKRGKKATEEEARAVMKAVKEAVGECKGAGEVKSEGVVGGVMTVVYEGRKIEEKREEGKAGEKAV
ncbi:Nn.00g000190.m01.CDS01 [Neocucurbitaria sp. VM-36]